MNNETIIVLILGAYFLVFLLCFWFISEDLSIEPETGILITVAWPIALPLYFMWKFHQSRQSISKQYEKAKNDIDYSDLISNKISREEYRKYNKDLLEHCANLEYRLKNQEDMLEKICPHKDTYLRTQTLSELLDVNEWSYLTNYHQVSDGIYEIMGQKVSTYQKVCKVCGNVKGITKKQYLTYQKETIESSLKECE